MIKAVIWGAFLVGLYVILYLMNKKTPKPEGCEDVTAQCQGCNVINCRIRDKENNDD